MGLRKARNYFLRIPFVRMIANLLFIQSINDITVVGDGTELVITPQRVSGVTQPLTFTPQDLPPRWTVDTATGVMNGTINDAFDQQVSVGITDGVDSETDRFQFTITPPTNPFAGLAAGTIVLMPESGQSNKVGTVRAAPSGLTLSRTWKISTSNNSIESLEPSASFSRPGEYFSALFETANPNLYLLWADHGDGGEGFRDGAGTFAPGGSARLELFRMISSAAEFLLTGDVPFVIGPFPWQHGNAETNNDASANSYESYLVPFYNEVEGALPLPQGESLKTIATRFIVPTYDPEATTGVSPRITTVRSALVNNSTKYVNLDDITNTGDPELSVDNVHYTGVGYQEIAQRLFNSVQSFDASSFNVIDPNVGDHLDTRDYDEDSLPAELTFVGPIRYTASSTFGLRLREQGGNAYVYSSNVKDWNTRKLLRFRGSTSSSHTTLYGISSDPVNRSAGTTLVLEHATGNILFGATNFGTLLAPASGIFYDLEFTRVNTNDIRVRMWTLATNSDTPDPNVNGYFFRNVYIGEVIATGAATTLTDPRLLIDIGDGNLGTVLFKDLLDFETGTFIW